MYLPQLLSFIVYIFSAIDEMSNKHGKCKIFIHKRIPITSWLPKYDSKVALADAIAGVTVGLTVMPQALAYAALAGLQPQVFTFY